MKHVFPSVAIVVGVFGIMACSLSGNLLAVGWAAGYTLIAVNWLISVRD
jgi:hypothetical protein